MTTTRTNQPNPAGNGQRSTPGVRNLAVEAPAGARRVRIPEVVVGAALVVGFALAAVIWQANATQRSPALALTRDVQRGEVIGEADVRTVFVGTDQPVTLLPPKERSAVVGQAAVIDIAAGTLLARSHVSGMTLQPGQGVVGLALEPGQFPSERLVAGDIVNIVALTGTEVRSSVIAERAVVFSVEALSGQSRRLISVRTDEQSANRVAGAAELGPVRLVLVSA